MRAVGWFRIYRTVSGMFKRLRSSAQRRDRARPWNPARWPDWSDTACYRRWRSEL